MKTFTLDDVTFVCGVKDNIKFVELESFINENQDLDLGESNLLKDCKVQLYTGISINNKRGKKH